VVAALSFSRQESLGRSVGRKIATGPVRVIPNASELAGFQQGEVLVTDKTDPDWEPIMKKAAAIVTNRGGRTCHAAIVSRELGVPAIVGTEHATATLGNGRPVTVSCAEGTRDTCTMARCRSRSSTPISRRFSVRARKS
jgi:pyruvate,water dikinase